METSIKANGLAQLKAVLNNETMKKNFQNILSESAAPFMASIIELYQSDNALQSCNPNAVVLEALKAATLKLPINKALGFAYIIPYGTTPTFQLGYKGIIQLAQRSGQYKFINADIVYEGEEVSYNRVTGMLEISGKATSDNAIGYFAYFQLLNGFEKAVYWTKERVTAHAKRYSKQFNNKNGSWQTSFDAMALKTVIRNIISKYGIMSVEMSDAVANDLSDDRIEAEVRENANAAPLEIPSAVVVPAEPVDEANASLSMEPDF